MIVVLFFFSFIYLILNFLRLDEFFESAKLFEKVQPYVVGNGFNFENPHLFLRL